MKASTFTRILVRMWHLVNLKLRDAWSVADYYREMTGVKIGSGCRIMDRRLNLFGSEPYLIEIGDNVTLAEGVRLITHDGGVAVLRNKYPDINVYGRIKIGSNCFIGMDAIILPGVEIGDNCVVGAGAVVTRAIPDGSVVAGVPARIICSLEEYDAKALEHGIMQRFSSEIDKKTKIMRFLEKL